MVDRIVIYLWSIYGIPCTFLNNAITIIISITTITTTHNYNQPQHEVTQNEIIGTSMHFVFSQLVIGPMKIKTLHPAKAQVLLIIVTLFQDGTRRINSSNNNCDWWYWPKS
jgi:hypothetical protein